MSKFKTQEEIKAEIARLQKQLEMGIDPQDEALIAISDKIADLSDERQISEKQIFFALAERFKLDIAGSKGVAKKTGTKKPSAINIIRSELKAKGVGPFPVGAEGNEAAKAKYIELEGHAAYDKILADHPPTIKK